MLGEIFIGEEKIGEADFKIVDKSMGGIGGCLIPSKKYDFYRAEIQRLTESKGIANISDFDFRILLKGDIAIKPAGGIGITDVKGVDEVYVESAGIDREMLGKINN